MAKTKSASPGKAVVSWLEDYRRRRSRLLWLGSLGSLLVSVPVLIAMWWAIWVFLIGPSLVGLSIRLAKAAIAARQIDPASVGLALATLVDAGQRVTVNELARTVRSPRPAWLLRELLLVDGVILLTADDPALTLTDSLRHEIAAAVRARKVQD